MITVIADEAAWIGRQGAGMPGASSQESYAAIWREPGGAIATGKVVLDRDAFRLEGATTAGHLSRRKVPYLEVVGVRIGREPDERLNGRPTLVLERLSAPPLQLDVLGVGMVFELADLLAALTLERAEQVERMLVLVPLKPDALERARALVASGPPFDPAQKGLIRHEVFFTDTDAVFLFEGRNVNDLVQRLVREPGTWRAAVEWRRLLAASPRVARPGYSWADRETQPDTEEISLQPPAR
jgi:hypothetical protein